MTQAIYSHLRIKSLYYIPTWMFQNVPHFLKKSKKCPSKDRSSEGPVHYSSSISSSLGIASKNAQHFLYIFLMRLLIAL